MKELFSSAEGEKRQHIKIYLHNNFDYARLAIKYINIKENNTVSITIMNIIKSDIAVHKQQAGRQLTRLLVLENFIIQYYSIKKVILNKKSKNKHKNKSKHMHY